MGSGRSHPTDESVDRGILSKLVGEAPRTSGKFRLALCMVLGIALAFSIPLSNEPLLFDIFLVCMILMGGLQALGTCCTGAAGLWDSGCDSPVLLRGRLASLCLTCFCGGKVSGDGLHGR